MNKPQKTKGIPFAKVKEKALRNKAVLAAYEKAKREDNLLPNG